MVQVWLAYHRKLQRMCGTYATAKYLRNKGYTLEEALFCLAIRRRDA
jgi:hypothetical protein